MTSPSQSSEVLGIPRIRFARPAASQTASVPAAYWPLLAFLILLYANTPIIMPALEVVRPAKLVAAAALLLLVVGTILSERKLDFAWPQGPLLLAFTAAAALSCLSALWPGFAVASLTDLIKMALVFFLIVNCVSSEGALRGVMWTLLAGGLFPALGTLKHYLQGNLIEGRASWVGIFANPNETAYALVILLPLTIYLASAAGWFTRALLAGIAVAYLAAIFLTYSRGGLVGLVAVLAILAWRRRSFWMIAVMAICLAAGLVIASSHWSRGETFSQLGQDNSFQGRIVTSRAGLQMFLDNPLVGVGLNCSVVAWPLYAPPGFYTRGALVTHNTFVQALSETGLLGFIPFCLFLGFGLHFARKMSLGEENSKLGSAMEASLWGLVACGMSGGYVLTWFPYVLLGLATAAKRVTEKTR